MENAKMATLMLHTPDEACDLPDSYKRALSTGEEVLLLSAYLTQWSKEVQLNPSCTRFRMIVGKDFGITRKAACRDVLKWLPKKHRVNFRVADQISGFHPKAVFWKDKEGRFFAVIGSSNLSAAAFQTNYEANVELEITAADYESAGKWVEAIAQLSVPVSEDWLTEYVEAAAVLKKGASKGSTPDTPAVFSLKLPQPKGTVAAIAGRRSALAAHRKDRRELIDLIRRCASGHVSSADFYRELPAHWGGSVGGRLQGAAWVRTGRNSDFRKLAKSVVAIMDARPSERDDKVIEEIDKLRAAGVSTRKAFLSELLCFEFPDLYPVLNQPVQDYLKANKYRGAVGLTEGGRYVDLAQRLRLLLAQNPKHPARNLLELDIAIWLAQG